MLKATPLRITCAKNSASLSSADSAPARRAHKVAQSPPLYENRLCKVLCSFFAEHKGSVPRVSFYKGCSAYSAHGKYHV